MSKPIISKKFVQVVAIIAAVIIALIFGPRIAAYLAAPHFSKLTYVETRNDWGCLAIITDATCHTEYIYSAKGTEKDLATAVTEDLKRQGYQPDYSDDLSYQFDNFSCDASGAKDSYDLYFFKNPLLGIHIQPECTSSSTTKVGTRLILM